MSESNVQDLIFVGGLTVVGSVWLVLTYKLRMKGKKWFPDGIL